MINNSLFRGKSESFAFAARSLPAAQTRSFSKTIYTRSDLFEPPPSRIGIECGLMAVFNWLIDVCGCPSSRVPKLGSSESVRCVKNYNVAYVSGFLCFLITNSDRKKYAVEPPFGSNFGIVETHTVNKRTTEVTRNTCKKGPNPALLPPLL